MLSGAKKRQSSQPRQSCLTNNIVLLSDFAWCKETRTLYGHACEYDWIEMPPVITAVSPDTGIAKDFVYLDTTYLDDEAFTALYACEDMVLVMFYYD